MRKENRREVREVDGKLHYVEYAETPFEEVDAKSKASELIERAEREAGCRFDDPNNPAALWAIFGAVAREAGYSKHDSRDDYVAGAIIANHDSEQDRGMEALMMLVGMGLSPDEAKDFLGGKS